MPLKDIVIRPGVNRENTRYAAQLLGVNNSAGYITGWYESNLVRFRQGMPESVGGWLPITNATFLGICRSLWSWVTLAYLTYIGVGTNLKFYIQSGGAYYDITPIRASYTLGNNPFSTVNGSNIVTVTDTTGGYINGDFVTFSGATAINGITLNGQYQITCSAIAPTSYTVKAATLANATSPPSGGGSAVVATYQINTGPALTQTQTGWGSGAWGAGQWGYGATQADPLRLWSQDNYGQDLVFCPIGGPVYYWNGNNSPTVRAVSLATIPITTQTASITASSTSVTLSASNTSIYQGSIITGTGIPFGTTVATISGTSLTLSQAATATNGAVTLSFGGTDLPLSANWLIVSDSSRFLLLFGTNDTASTTFNPMLVRWSDQESLTTWTPSPTNQAGSIPLSHGTHIVTALQMNQQILVYTDSSLYAGQYVGTPTVWAFTLVGETQSIASPNAAVYANGVAYWMGYGKFYQYNGTMTTLRCDLKKYIFDNLDPNQYLQVTAGTNEEYNEVWWFYTSINTTNGLNDSYVVYNYLDDIWYYGSLSRTAWLQNGLYQFPIGATGANQTLVLHENGLNNNETGVSTPLNTYITSAEFDVQDGTGAASFIWRMLPDFTFYGSTATNPQVTMSFYPMLNSGSGYSTPQSVGNISTGAITETATYPIEQFTGQVNIRVRGRQIYFTIAGNQLNLSWQSGIHRFDWKSDGLRG
jgi:hypothetical protein